MSLIFAHAAQQWAAMRSEYEAYLESAYVRALEATAGVLVNTDGRRERIDGYSLFTGPAARAERYASWELKEHWQTVPRLTLNAFEQRWLQGVELRELALTG